MTAVHFHKALRSWMKQSMILELSAGPIHCNYFVLRGLLYLSVRRSWVVRGTAEKQRKNRIAKKGVLFSSRLLEIMLKGESSTHTFSHTLLNPLPAQLWLAGSTCGDSQVLRAYVRCLLGILVCDFLFAHSHAFELKSVLPYFHNNLPSNIRFLFHRPSEMN